MSYCLSIKLDSGIVFASDSRTSAGVDNISSYSKMHTFKTNADRIFILLSVGNLGTSQAVVNLLQRDLEQTDGTINLNTVNYMFDAAHYIGELSCKVQNMRCEVMTQSGANMEASFILGGQIAGHPHETYHIYPEGNYITSSPIHPFLQIGETKYGKPILDRILNPSTNIEDAARCALVSLDSTMRSNLSVGPPLELAIVKADTYKIDRHIVCEVDSPFFVEVQNRWREGLANAFNELPRFEWEI